MACARSASVLRVSILAPALFAFLAPLAADPPAGSVAGRVSDRTGSGLPGVAVTLTAADGSPAAVAVTGPEGTFAFAPVAAGEYRVESALPGFETRSARVSVEAGSEVEIDLVMTLRWVMESITVVAEGPRSFAANVVAEPMIAQQAPVTSVLAVVDNLPGVSVQEGDLYGGDDWSTGVTMRGFQVNRAEAQIGTTIDGMPNGTSDYWSGSKANRFVDQANMGGVTVSQGTADIASRSIEALGGTFDFRTGDPAPERAFRAALGLGEADGQWHYLRLDTGPLLGGSFHAWTSVVRQQSADWVQGSMRGEREHLAGKFRAEAGRVRLTGYVSHDDADNPSYQRVLSDAEYRENPRWDRLTDTWTGVPFVNQVYRRGWAVPRRNSFGYLKAEFAPTEVLEVAAGAYAHHMWGRGDWMPPYLVDVTDDRGGPESELLAGVTARGGESIGRLYFVDPGGRSLAPEPGCASSLRFPYGGGGPEYDPACHPANAVPVQSYRHSHYGKNRAGATLDGDWFAGIGPVETQVRAGLWFEQGRRELGRDWHRIVDARVSNDFDETPYWRQYDWRFPQRVARWYVEETLFAGPALLRVGVRQYLVEVTRQDRFAETPDLSVSSNSDPLLSGGITWTAPVPGLELFAGYAQNFKSLPDRLLEVPGRSLAGLEPETADNLDLGLRYSRDPLALTATAYRIDFSNRIFFLHTQTETGPSYLVPGGGAYFNAGGVESRGVELSATCRVGQTGSLYASWTWSDADYIGVGDPLVDAAQGIAPGSPVVGIPGTLLVLSADRSGDVLAAGLSAKYTSSRPVTLDGSWEADAYWLADAYVTWSADGISDKLRGLEAALVANNLLDRTYLSTITGQGAFLGAPRTVSLNLTASF